MKRWQDGDMRKHWTAAGMLVAEQQFPVIICWGKSAGLLARRAGGLWRRRPARE